MDDTHGISIFAVTFFKLIKNLFQHVAFDNGER